MKVLGISREEYEELVNYSKWLNEIAPPKDVPKEAEEVEEEAEE